MGPIHTQRSKANKRAKGVEFMLLQQGAMLKLEYPDMPSGIAARRQILGDTHSHAVPSNKLLGAIQEALEQAKQPPPYTETAEPEEPAFDHLDEGHELTA